MKRLLAVLLGFLPIPIGMLFQQMIFSIQLPLYNILLSLGFLLFWMLLSRLLRKWLSSTRQTILLLNLPSFLFFILMLMPFVRPAWINSFFYPEIVLSAIILNLIESLIQMLSPVHLVFFGSNIHILSFLLRIAFCWLGCRSVKKA